MRLLEQVFRVKAVVVLPFNATCRSNIKPLSTLIGQYLTFIDVGRSNIELVSPLIG